MAATFPYPADIVAHLRQWGWQENVYRRIAAPTDTTVSASIAVLEISLYRFGRPAGVIAALDYFVAARAAALGLQEEPTATVEDAARAISGPVDRGFEATLYVRRGYLLLRVSTVGDPASALATTRAIADANVQKTTVRPD